MELKTVLDSGFYKIKDFVNRNLDSGFSSLVGFPISVLSCILDSSWKAHDGFPYMGMITRLELRKLCWGVDKEREKAIQLARLTDQLNFWYPW